MAGAKTKYRKEMCDEAQKLFAEGMLKQDVATALGISVDTFYTYIKNKSEFSEAVKRGQWKCRQYHINNIREAGNKNWQASAWWLERTHRKEFGRYDTIQHEGQVKVDHKIDKKDPKLKDKVINMIK